MEQRKHTRYRVEYAGSFSGDKISAQGVILDLSSVGCKARSTVVVEKGDFVGVLIDVPRYETPLQVALAVVRWSNGQDFGMEFIRIEPNHQQRLHELIQATEAARALPQDTVTTSRRVEGPVAIPLDIFEDIKEGPANLEKNLLYAWMFDLDVRTVLLLAESVDAALVE